MPPRPSGHLALGSAPFELKSPDEYPLLIRDDQPKTDAAVAVEEITGEALRRPATTAVGDPAAPTKHLIPPRNRARGIRLGSRRKFAIPIAAPLPDISVHVIQTPGVGCIATYGLYSF